MKTYVFEEILIKDDKTDGAYVKIPEEIGKEFNPKGRVKVKAQIEGIDYRGSLVKMGKPYFILGILKSIRQTVGKDIGDIFHVTFYEDLEERTVKVPIILQEEFEKNPASELKFNTFSYSRKKEMIAWVADAKKLETREKRINKIIKICQQ